MKCRDRILGKVLNDDVAKVVMMFVGLWLLGTLMSHAQTSLSSKQDIGKRHELYFGVGLLNLYVIDKHDKLTKPIPYSGDYICSLLQPCSFSLNKTNTLNIFPIFVICVSFQE